MKTSRKVARPLTLPELLEQAHTALNGFLLDRGDLTDCGPVEDAAVLVYEAMALVDPGIASDFARDFGERRASA